MALIECKVCGNKVSFKAKQCPHCGAPFQLEMSKRGGIILFVACIMFGIIVSQDETVNKIERELQKPVEVIPDTESKTPSSAQSLYEATAKALSEPVNDEPTEQEQTQIQRIEAAIAKTQSTAANDLPIVVFKNERLFIECFVVLPDNADPIAIVGRQIAPMFKAIFESVDDVERVHWIVNAPYEDSLGNTGTQMISTFQTSRFLYDMVNWKRFKSRNLLKVAEKVQWLLQE